MRSKLSTEDHALRVDDDAKGGNGSADMSACVPEDAITCRISAVGGIDQVLNSGWGFGPTETAVSNCCLLQEVGGADESLKTTTVAASANQAGRIHGQVTYLASYAAPPAHDASVGDDA